jgi:hypothetical protein
MSVPIDERHTALVSDLDIEGEPFLTPTYWTDVVDRGLDAVFHAYTEDVQPAVDDHVCHLSRAADIYPVTVDDNTLQVPRTDWTTLRVVFDDSRREQLLAQKYQRVADRTDQPASFAFEEVVSLSLPDAHVEHERVPSWGSALVTGQLMTESETIEAISVPRERLVGRLAEALAANPVAIAELETLAELQERLDADAVRFVESDE